MNRKSLCLLLFSVFLSWACLAQTAKPVGTALPFDRFWNDVMSQFQDDFLKFDSSGFADLCRNHGVLPGNTANRKTYATIGLLHQLMTSQSPSNCSKEGILQIPYYWHWGNSRPRRDIVWTQTGQSLHQVAPPHAFRRYQCIADIDRTPDIFWQDLLTSKPRYFSTTCDSFYTFGWCSEREMAYQAFLRSIDFLPSDEQRFVARVIVEGAHSWTEIAVKMQTGIGQEAWFLVTVDNTYHEISWVPANRTRVDALRRRNGLTQEDRWYNRQSKAESIIQGVKSLQVPVVVQNRIVSQLTAFFAQN